MTDQEKNAIEIFKNSGLVIFPTDTAVGIGCRMDDSKAIEKLFEIRKRPENKPLLVLVDSVEMAQRYLLLIPDDVKEKLINKYWPGKLTIILKCDTSKIPSLVRGNRDTLGIRLPNVPWLRELIREVGVPIVAPSANFGGEKTPFNFKDLNKELIKKVDFVLNENEVPEGKVSTIIDCSVIPWEIIREGAVKINLK